MKTVQMTLDADLVSAVDRAARRLGTTRSAFTRTALRESLARLREAELDQRHREGYRRKPVRRGEFGAWQHEQEWGDPW
ncbi:MAG: ribbon-helix-helix protein, CopG family [Deltaproteobacteria bacterium]|nr:ribbon-helix-helix protein, CopG family [Deltaproteobacteria bacterium]